VHPRLQILCQSEAVFEADDRPTVEREEVRGEVPEIPAPEVARTGASAGNSSDGASASASSAG
jgi:hypothetical protein